jgi:hypothetical protein
MFALINFTFQPKFPGCVDNYCFLRLSSLPSENLILEHKISIDLKANSSSPSRLVKHFGEMSPENLFQPQKVIPKVSLPKCPEESFSILNSSCNSYLESALTQGSGHPAPKPSSVASGNMPPSSSRSEGEPAPAEEALPQKTGFEKRRVSAEAMQ